MASSSNINKKRALVYTEDEITCILQIWADEKIQSKFKTNMRHNLIWEQIKTQLFQYGYDRSASEIKIKIQNLKSEYKKLKPSSGSATPTWPFYSIIHQVLGQRDICNRSLVLDSLVEELENENYLEETENNYSEQFEPQVMITLADVHMPPSKKFKSTDPPKPSTSKYQEFPILPQSPQVKAQPSPLQQRLPEEQPQTPPPQQTLPQPPRLQRQLTQEQTQAPHPQQPEELTQTPPPQQTLLQPLRLQRQQTQEQIQAPHPRQPPRLQQQQPEEPTQTPPPQQRLPQPPLRINRPPRRQGTEENRLINQLIINQNQYMENLARQEERDRRAEERAITAAERESRLSESMITFFNTYTHYLNSHMQNPQILSPLSVIPPHLIPQRPVTPTVFQQTFPHRSPSPASTNRATASQQTFPHRSPSPDSRSSPPPNISALINRATRYPSVILQPIPRTTPPQFLLKQQQPSPQPHSPSPQLHSPSLQQHSPSPFISQPTNNYSSDEN